MEDSMIVDLYWAREERAIEESDRKYGRYCLSIARSIVTLEEDAEECVNDTWFRAWNAMPPQRPSLLSAFFGKLTRNLSLDRWRHNRAAKRGGPQVEMALEELEDCLPAPGRPEEHLEERETAALISRFLREQPALDRNLFLRRYWYLDSIADIARRFSLSESKVKTTLFRCRGQLRTYFEKEGHIL